MALADVAVFALLWWIAGMRRRGTSAKVAGVYVITTVILEHVLYDRLDLLMLLSILGALAAWLHADHSPHRDQWRAAAYIVAALGATYKLIPIVMLPFLLGTDLRTTRRWSTVAFRADLWLVVGLAPFAIAYPSAGLSSFAFLGYHASRGLEIGSKWASGDVAARPG